MTRFAKSHCGVGGYEVLGYRNVFRFVEVYAPLSDLRCFSIRFAPSGFNSVLFSVASSALDWSFDVDFASREFFSKWFRHVVYVWWMWESYKSSF